MKSLFAQADVGLIGLLLFFAFFCGVIIWTFRPGAKKNYDEHAHIPLNEKEKGSTADDSVHTDTQSET